VFSVIWRLFGTRGIDRGGARVAEVALKFSSFRVLLLVVRLFQRASSSPTPIR